MKATIKTYNGNADLFFKDMVNYSIRWDDMTWDNEKEWEEWAKEVLEPIEDAENYDEIKLTLHIYTDHFILD